MPAVPDPLHRWTLLRSHPPDDWPQPLLWNTGLLYWRSEATPTSEVTSHTACGDTGLHLWSSEVLQQGHTHHSSDWCLLLVRHRSASVDVFGHTHYSVVQSHPLDWDRFVIRLLKPHPPLRWLKHLKPGLPLKMISYVCVCSLHIPWGASLGFDLVSVPSATFLYPRLHGVFGSRVNLYPVKSLWLFSAGKSWYRIFQKHLFDNWRPSSSPHISQKHTSWTNLTVSNNVSATRIKAQIHKKSPKLKFWIWKVIFSSAWLNLKRQTKKQNI